MKLWFYPILFVVVLVGLYYWRKKRAKDEDFEGIEVDLEDPTKAKQKKKRGKK